MGRKDNAGFQPLPKILPHNVPYISNPEDRGERLQAEVFRAVYGAFGHLHLQRLCARP